MKTPGDRRHAMSSEIVIDDLTPADFQAVRVIYQEGIATGQATFEPEAMNAAEGTGAPW